MAKLQKHRIKRRNEETDCTWCGYSMYVGTHVLLEEMEGGDYTGDAFCSAGCWDKMKAWSAALQEYVGANRTREG